MTREEHERARQEARNLVILTARNMRDVSRSLLLEDETALAAWDALDTTLRALDSLTSLRMSEG